MLRARCCAESHGEGWSLEDGGAKGSAQWRVGEAESAGLGKGRDRGGLKHNLVG